MQGLEENHLHTEKDHRQSTRLPLNKDGTEPKNATNQACTISFAEFKQRRRRQQREVKKKRFNTRNNFARVSHFSSPLLHKSVTNTKEFAFAYPTFLNNMARDDGRPLATSSLGQPFRRLKRLAPLAKRSTCSKSNRSRVTQKTSVFIGF